MIRTGEQTADADALGVVQHSKISGGRGIALIVRLTWCGHPKCRRHFYLLLPLHPLSVIIPHCMVFSRRDPVCMMRIINDDNSFVIWRLIYGNPQAEQGRWRGTGTMQAVRCSNIFTHLDVVFPSGVSSRCRSLISSVLTFYHPCLLQRAVTFPSTTPFIPKIGLAQDFKQQIIGGFRMALSGQQQSSSTSKRDFDKVRTRRWTTTPTSAWSIRAFWLWGGWLVTHRLLLSFCGGSSSHRSVERVSPSSGWAFSSNNLHPRLDTP